MLIDDCHIKTNPFDHQLKEWKFSRDLVARAIHWEQGVGKTKLDIDCTAWQYSRGAITGHLVLAPNGVHRNWVTEEMPAHWPTELGAPAALWYRSGSSGTKWHQEKVDEVVNAKGCLAMLTMSYDSLLTDTGKAAAKAFLTAHRCKVTCDESGRIKNPSAKRTRLAFKVGALSAYRRTLNGTPVPNGAFDIYSQIKFLDPAFWERHGISSFQGFKTQFGEWGSGYCVRDGVRRNFPELLGYRNLEILNKWLEEIATRVTKEDAGLNLPPKLYKRLTYALSPAQRRVYDQLRDECLAYLDSGEVVTAPLAMVLALRLQQVACGYVPVELPDESGDDPLRKIGDDSPRLDMLMEVVEDLPHKAIIWARFRRDIDDILVALKKAGKEAARYDGAVDDDGLAAAAEGFQRGSAQFFVSNPAKGGEGLTLLGDQSQDHLSVKTVVYYSCSYSLLHRLQSEDRAHRIGQKNPVQYIDITAEDTVDLRVVENLKAKMDVASQVNGDKLREWLA